MTDPFGSTEQPQIDLTAYGERVSQAVYDSIQNATKETARSRQAQRRVIGVSNLGHCFAGETEAPTRQGIKTLRELAGSTAELLVPAKSGDGLSPRAEWKEVEIKSFGYQPLLKVTLASLGGEKKVVHATPNHQWFVTRDKRNRGYKISTTEDLKVGDRMRMARAGNAKTASLIPSAAVMGFTHGDGNVRHSDSEVRIPRRSNKVDSLIAEILPSLAGSVSTDEAGTRYRGLPKSWKAIPDFSQETPAFALSWLAGYFAADGTVNRNGGCPIQSSNRESLEAVRYAAVLAGIRVGEIQETRVKGGYGFQPNEERVVYTTSLRRRSVPDWFFLNSHHKERARKANEKPERDESWSVKSVETTSRVEEVYCAVVPEVEAFVLTDDLVTHNCREYLRFMFLDQEDTDERDMTPAWIGTVLGDALEQQIKKDHPDWIIQEEMEFPLPSGGFIKGHSDIIIPASAGITVEQLQAGEEGFVQGILDLKSKAELETIRRYGPSLQQKFQIHAYAKAAIAKGHLDPAKPILVGDVYFDRSGRDVTPYGVFHLYSEAVIEQIDEWVSDVTYAVKYGERASQDKPIEWCANWCPVFTVCRGAETTPTGLLTDETITQAVGLYATGAEMAREGEKLKKLAKENLEGVEGSTGEYTIKNVYVGPTEIPGYVRKGYHKLEVRKVPKSKKKEQAK